MWKSVMEIDQVDHLSKPITHDFLLPIITSQDLVPIQIITRQIVVNFAVQNLFISIIFIICESNSYRLSARLDFEVSVFCDSVQI